MPVSPFLDQPPSAWVASNDLAFALRDAFPVSPGHTLVVPRRLIADWFQATADEQRALLELVDTVKRGLDRQFKPDGYNVGFNAGVAAGQTVMHLHVHVIPRYVGDMDDPRGGVRGVIPAQQKYDGAAAAPVEDPFADLPEFLPGQEEGLGEVLREACRRADTIDLLAAFVQPSGLDEIEGDLVDALQRQAQVRVLTSDYLGVTHPHALQRLYTLTTSSPNFHARLWRVDHLAFHPKAYLFRRGVHGVAFVGSSNLSGSALGGGIEWNLRAVSTRQSATFARIVARFGGLWDSPRSVPLSPEVVAAYASTVVRLPPMPEPNARPPEPHVIQQEVLAHLERARAEGAVRGLVVMATGLGKTYLSAFDFAVLGGKRALFIAHREEILDQAAYAWQRVFPDRSVGRIDGDRKEIEADLVFASVATLAKAKSLLAFAPGHFDYVVVDEFHHAAAPTYRRVLAHFAPRFLLGLTATPDRTDAASLLELCDHNLVARVGIVEGVTRGFLSPSGTTGSRTSSTTSRSRGGPGSSSRRTSRRRSRPTRAPRRPSASSVVTDPDAGGSWRSAAPRRTPTSPRAGSGTTGCPRSPSTAVRPRPRARGRWSGSASARSRSCARWTCSTRGSTCPSSTRC